MITRQQVEQLQQFHDPQFLVTSCYLDLDRAQMPLPALKIRAKDLLQSARQQLEAKAASHPQRESLQHDFDRLEQFVIEDVAANRQKAVAIFSCAGAKFWQVYRLPRLVRNVLVADPAPYVRPLLGVLGQYERYGVLVADPVRGQLFEAYMGEIVAHPVISDDVPRKVRDGGFGGRDERSNERYRDGAVQQHLEHVAAAAFDLFKQRPFDRLVLGGTRETLAGLKRHLHHYLRQRWTADFHAEPGRTTPGDVLVATMEIEERFAEERGRKLVDELLRQARVGERAVTGLPATVAAVGRGEAQTLVVEDGFAMPGMVCRGCRQVIVDAENCPRCGQPAEECADVVDEVVGAATATNCGIHYVSAGTALHEAGRVGALLRY